VWREHRDVLGLIVRRAHRGQYSRALEDHPFVNSEGQLDEEGRPRCPATCDSTSHLPRAAQLRNAGAMPLASCTVALYRNCTWTSRRRAEEQGEDPDRLPGSWRALRPDLRDAPGSRGEIRFRPVARRGALPTGPRGSRPQGFIVDGRGGQLQGNGQLWSFLPSWRASCSPARYL
jgi:hypothetical protein